MKIKALNDYQANSVTRNRFISSIRKVDSHDYVNSANNSQRFSPAQDRNALSLAIEEGTQPKKLYYQIYHIGIIDYL